MNRHLTALIAAAAAVAALTPSARASRQSGWSEPVNLGSAINSPYEESGPAISNDGRALYFQSNRPGSNNCDIWVARRESLHDDWETPQNLGAAVNGEICESAPALSRDEHHLFFARLSPTQPADIWVSYRRNVHDDFGWEAPVPLNSAINTEASDGTPKHFESRRYGLSQLYFYSTRPGGLGSFDIYVASAFGTPVSVPELNSPQIDASPTLSRNGLEIVFHSNRLGAIGQRDLWTSVRSNVLDPWSPPMNLGDVVNSTSNEQTTALSADGETLFFGSDRPDGFGGYDLYMTTRTTHRRR